MRVVLVSMPFGSLSLPSLALTQLSAVLRRRFGGRVAVETLYANFEFARHLGDPGLYGHALSSDGFMTGIGDWFFRQAAFPGAPDNAEAYFDRFYFDDEEPTRSLRRKLAEKRAGLDEFLRDLVIRHRLAEADLVGFTTLFSQTVPAFALARHIKDANPDVLTVIGGGACEGEMGQEFARRVPMIDYVFSGPGLVSFPAFLQALLDGDADGRERIPGVFSRRNEALWQRGEEDAAAPVGLVGEEFDINTELDLDYAPFLDAFERAFPAGEAKPVLLFETSRGCSWAQRSPCTFCGLTGLRHHYHFMAPAQALARLRSLFRWLPRCRSFLAVDTILPRGYLEAVFPVLDTPPGTSLMYEVRPDLSDAELAVLHAAGVVAIQPGIEALSTATLKLMSKGTTAFRNLRFLKDCSRHPISLDWNLLLFSPGEPEATREKYLRDLPLFAHLPPPTGAYPVMFVRHSRYARDPAAYGLELEPQDFYALTFPFADDALRRIARHMVDRRADTARQDYWLGKLNGGIEAWRARWLGRDGKPEARLTIVEDGRAGTVYDSRSGEVREHALDAATRRVLDWLEKPARAEDLRGALAEAGEPEERATRILAFLQERGLLFEEDGRYLSLVVPAAAKE